MFAKPYAKLYDKFYEKKPYKKEIEFVYRWAGKPKSIFDIGCGTASYWKFYPQATKLVGIDMSRAMALAARGVICGDITEYRPGGTFDCATALFDVVNYISNFDWWKNIPIEKGGLFIFDVWDKEKVSRDGFRETNLKIGDASRRITASYYDGYSVDLRVGLVLENGRRYTETHTMFLHSQQDIEAACKAHGFTIVDMKKTRTWQTWYKLRKK